MENKIAAALKKLEYGVYVVTMGNANDGNAFTASWVSQISSEPPMLALAVHNKHQSCRLIDQHNCFVVHLVAENHAEVAKAYYGPAESGYQKLKDTQLGNAPKTGCPLIPGMMGWLDCKVVTRVSSGNHTLFLAEIMAAEIQQDGYVLTTTNSKLRYLG